jgi:hypothetical protein
MRMFEIILLPLECPNIFTLVDLNTSNMFSTSWDILSAFAKKQIAKFQKDMKKNFCLQLFPRWVNQPKRKQISLRSSSRAILHSILVVLLTLKKRDHERAKADEQFLEYFLWQSSPRLLTPFNVNMNEIEDENMIEDT